MRKPTRLATHIVGADIIRPRKRHRYKIILRLLIHAVQSVAHIGHALPVALSKTFTAGLALFVTGFRLAFLQ